jgi:DNA-binding XRE family transcriptional regulator
LKSSDWSRCSPARSSCCSTVRRESARRDPLLGFTTDPPPPDVVCPWPRLEPEVERLREKGCAVNRAAELARARAAVGLDEESCAWFGVGRATIERIEAGEVEPGDELAARIDRFIQLCGGGLFPF